MWRFIVGFVVGAVVIVGIPLAVIAAGGINMGATAGTGQVEQKLATWAVDRSLATRVPEIPNPHATDSDALEVGLAGYRDSCLLCHGAPGVDPAGFAKGLNPPAPDLAKIALDRTDGELFWITKHGIRMTGMPAMGKAHSDDEVWKIVAFCRHLPDLTDDERKALR